MKRRQELAGLDDILTATGETKGIKEETGDSGDEGR